MAGERRRHGGFGDIGQYTLDVIQAADAPPLVERFTLPPLIDIVCEPLQPIEITGLIVSRDLTAPMVTPITTKAATIWSISPMVCKTVINGRRTSLNSLLVARRQRGNALNRLLVIPMRLDGVARLEACNE